MKFGANVPADFREQMIAYWMRSEKCDRAQAREYYDDDDFKSLTNRIAGKFAEFVYESDDECFECNDKNILVPIEILDITEPVISEICNGCSGSGEGYADGTTCQNCKGRGEVAA